MMFSSSVIVRNTLPLVEDSSVKAGCFTFDILEDGEILAMKHPPGHLIPFLQGCRRRRIQFMSCNNVKSTPRWALAFASEDGDFHKMSYGLLNGIDLIAVRGLTSRDSSTCLVYHKWKGKGCVPKIPELIEKYKDNPSGFLIETFEPSPLVVSIKQIWLHFVTHFQGNSFSHWPKPSSFVKNGYQYYCGGDQPLSWTSQDPFPHVSSMNQLFQLPNTYVKTNGCITKTKRRSDHNKAAGSPNRFYFDGFCTDIYHSNSCDLHHLTRVLDEKVYWQPLHNPTNTCDITFVSLSTKQHGKLKRQMKSSGPIPGPQFNEIAIRMSSEEGGQRIRVKRLSLDEVCIITILLLFLSIQTI